MKQHNQVGKKFSKDSILDAKVGRTFTSPSGKEYGFDYTKIGRKYTFVLIYKGARMQMTESQWNTSSIDQLIESIEQGMAIE